jgi:guanine nucleotide-binding protein G(i) subunit alpha
VPNAQDLLRVRIRSAGIEKAEYSFKETTFKYVRSASWAMTELASRVYDVGGQIPERRKWAKLLRICTAIIFFASLSEYDQKYGLICYSY